MVIWAYICLGALHLTGILADNSNCVGVLTANDLYAQLAAPGVGAGGTNILICGDLVLPAPAVVKDSFNIVGNCLPEPCKISPASTFASSTLISIEDTVPGDVSTFAGLRLSGATATAVSVLPGRRGIFTNVTFDNNAGPTGGGVYSEGSVTFESCTFLNNTATSEGGGAISGNGANNTLSMRGCTFSGNSAATTGGAIQALDTVADIRGSVFTANRALQGGGAVWLRGSGKSTIAGNTFQDNRAQGDSSQPLIVGGALVASRVTFFSGNVFNRNFALTAGGGASIDASVNVCGVSLYNNNTAFEQDTASDLYVSGAATSICPVVPPSTGGSLAPTAVPDCTLCNCATTGGPCDPSATCSATASGAVCTCNASFIGTGYYCAQGAIPVPLPGVVSTPFTAPPPPQKTFAPPPQKPSAPPPSVSPPPPPVKPPPSPTVTPQTTVCTCPFGQSPGIAATPFACKCNYPLTASYLMVDKNLADWTTIFSSSFTNDLAGLIGVQPSQILYSNVSQGSIVLDTNVVPLSGPTLDNATVSRISGVLQQGQPLSLSPSQYGTVLVTSVGQPAQLTSDGGGSDHIGVIIGSVVGGVAGVLVVIALLIWWRKRNFASLPTPPRELAEHLGALETSLSGRGGDSPLPTPGAEDIAERALFGTFRRFTYEEIETGTDFFALINRLGEGAFGQVYKGRLTDGTMVAVKRLKNTRGQAESNFESELSTLGRVRHRNLVALKGFCVAETNFFLILDFAPGGNLDQALRSSNRPPLTWSQRMKIAVGAARGLSYLHNDCEPTIIHRDIKSENILLDSRGEAEVADFGLSKLLDPGQTHYSTRVAGTFGYLAPEYLMNGQITTKTDVYSFGVVLLEIITGHKAVHVTRSRRTLALTDWVLERVRQPLANILDSRLNGEYFPEQAERLLQLALRCINRSEVDLRPSMREVLHTLEGLGSATSAASQSSWSQANTSTLVHTGSDFMTEIHEGR